MRNRNGSFFSGVAVGVVAGLLTGAIGVAHSATGKQAWDRFGNMFQAGYVAGFLDCVRLAKGMDTQGYIARNYRQPRGAKPGHYQAWINEEYKKPEAAERALPQMLILAGHAMEAQFGPEKPLGNVPMRNLRKFFDQRRTGHLEREKANEAAGTAKAEGAAEPGEAARTPKTEAAPATQPEGVPPAEAPAAE